MRRGAPIKQSLILGRVPAMLQKRLYYSKELEAHTEVKRILKHFKCMRLQRMHWISKILRENGKIPSN